jgi:hypothetical protein
MIAPDIIIRQYVDSKVNVEKMMEDAGMLSTNYNVSKTHEGNEDEDPPLSDYVPESDFSANEVRVEDSIQKFASLGSGLVGAHSNELKVFREQDPCRMK